MRFLSQLTVLEPTSTLITQVAVDAGGVVDVVVIVGGVLAGGALATGALATGALADGALADGALADGAT